MWTLLTFFPWEIFDIFHNVIVHISVFDEWKFSKSMICFILVKIPQNAGFRFGFFLIILMSSKWTKSSFVAKQVQIPLLTAIMQLASIAQSVAWLPCTLGVLSSIPCELLRQIFHILLKFCTIYYRKTAAKPKYYWIWTVQI